MKKFLKVLGAAALIAGFTPYQVEKNEETGERTVKALLWKATKKPSPSGNKDDITIKFLSFGKDEEEAPLFSDELTVEYSPRQDGEAVKVDDSVSMEENIEMPESPEAPEPPEAPEVPEAPEPPEPLEVSEEA